MRSRQTGRCLTAWALAGAAEMLLERIVRVVAFLVSVLFVLEAVSWLTAPIPPCLIQTTNEEQTTHHYDEKECFTFLIGSLILLGRVDHFVERHDKSIVAAFTVVLALSTIGLWLATVALWNAGERQLKLIETNAAQQSRDMQAAIAAAGDSARAANRTAQALIDAERPWVGLFTVTSVRIGANVEPYAEVVTQNTGRTPARSLRTKFVGDIRPQGDLPPIPDSGTEPARSLMPNTPDQYRPFEGLPSISQSTYDDVVAGRQVIWIVGRMDYLDDAGAPHWTTMRVFYRTDGRFHPHRQDNDAT